MWGMQKLDKMDRQKSTRGQAATEGLFLPSKQINRSGSGAHFRWKILAKFRWRNSFDFSSHLCLTLPLSLSISIFLYLSPSLCVSISVAHFISSYCHSPLLLAVYSVTDSVEPTFKLIKYDTNESQTFYFLVLCSAKRTHTINPTNKGQIDATIPCMDHVCRCQVAVINIICCWRMDVEHIRYCVCVR